MAGFESARVGPVGQAIREWRPGRFAPLYAAGVLAGIGIGVAIATWPSGGAELQEHQTAMAPLVVDEAPFFVLPEVPDGGGAELRPLPMNLEGLFGGVWWPAIETAAEIAAEEAPAPAIAPAPIAVAPAAKPAAPAPAAPAPAAPPAPAAAAPAPAEAPSKPNFYVPEVSSGAATTLETNLFNLINIERANAGLAPYQLEGGLTKIARTRSQQLIDQNYFAHRDPFGYSMYVELLAHFGYTTYAWAGENLAMNNWPSETSPNEAIRGLMASPTHRANILAGDFTRIGVGEIALADGRHFYTMIFLS